MNNKPVIFTWVNPGYKTITLPNIGCIGYLHTIGTEDKDIWYVCFQREGVYISPMELDAIKYEVDELNKD